MSRGRRKDRHWKGSRRDRVRDFERGVTVTREQYYRSERPSKRAKPKANP
jgi:hypothetical protein